MKKQLLTILMVCLSVLVLAACKDDEKVELKDRKEDYQSKYDLESTYMNDEELEIAKALIGTAHKEIEGKRLDGSSFSLSDELKGNAILKMSSLEDCQACLADVKENMAFATAVKDVSFISAFANVKDVEDFEGYYTKTETAKEENPHVVYTSDNKASLDYKAQYPPMYFFIDKDGYIAFILFGEQTADSLTETANMAFGTDYKSSGSEDWTEEAMDYFEEGQRSLEESIKDGTLEEIDKLNEEMMKSSK